MASSAITILASAQQTTDGAGDAVDCDAVSTLRVDLTISQNSECPHPELDVRLEHSADGVTWRDLARFDRGAALRTERLTVSGFDRWVRARWYLRGVAQSGFSATFGIAGRAV